MSKDEKQKEPHSLDRQTSHGSAACGVSSFQDDDC